MTRELHRRNATLADGLQKSMKLAQKKDTAALAAYGDALAFRKRIFNTGLFEVDLNLRPVFGSRIQLIGQAHQGKSVLVYKMIGAAHQTCRQCLTPIIDFVHDWTGEVARTCRCGKNDPMRVLLLDSENSFDPAWAKVWGVNIEDNFNPEDNTTSEQIMENVYLSPDANFVLVRGAEAEQARIIVENMIRDGGVDLVAVDSIANLVPHGRRAGKNLIGDHSKAVTQFITGVVAAQGEAANLDGVAPTLLMVNQLRVDIGGFSPNPSVTPMKPPGGEALKFNNSITWNLKTKYDDYEASTDGRNYGDCTLKATKDKESGATLSEASYRMYVKDINRRGVDYYAGDTDEGAKLYGFLKELGALDSKWFQKKGSKYIIFGREFTKVADAAHFLGRRDIGHLLRLPIFAQKFPSTLRKHLGAENYNYTPFKDDPILEMYEEAEKQLGSNVQSRKRELTGVMVGAAPKKKSRKKSASEEDVEKLMADEPEEQTAG